MASVASSTLHVELRQAGEVVGESTAAAAAGRGREPGRVRVARTIGRPNRSRYRAVNAASPPGDATSTRRCRSPSRRRRARRRDRRRGRSAPTTRSAKPRDGRTSSPRSASSSDESDEPAHRSDLLSSPRARGAPCRAPGGAVRDAQRGEPPARRAISPCPPGTPARARPPTTAGRRRGAARRRRAVWPATPRARRASPRTASAVSASSAASRWARRARGPRRAGPFSAGGRRRDGRCARR